MNPDDQRKRQRERSRKYLLTPRGRANNLRAVKKYAAAHPEKRREIKRKWSKRKNLRKYGLTVADLEQMQLRQENRCAICSEVFENVPCVDHDHATGKVRELLCGNCNLGLGCFRDNETTLFRAHQYLRQHS